MFKIDLIFNEKHLFFYRFFFSLLNFISLRKFKLPFNSLSHFQSREIQVFINRIESNQQCILLATHTVQCLLFFRFSMFFFSTFFFENVHRQRQLMRKRKSVNAFAIMRFIFVSNRFFNILFLFLSSSLRHIFFHSISSILYFLLILLQSKHLFHCAIDIRKVINRMKRN